MLSPLRNRFGIPGVISVIALVFAMLGGAYAASNDGGSGKATASAKAKKGPKGPRGPRGPAGPAGPQGLAGANGKDGANGSNGLDGEKGDKGDKGPKGDEGDKGDTGATGPEGPEGSPWTALGTLPPGETETGAWSFGRIAAGAVPVEPLEESLLVPISFSIPLASTLPGSNVHYLEKEAAPTADCPGSAADPKAAAGHLCVYTGAQSLGPPAGAEATFFVSAIQNPGASPLSAGAAKGGAVLLVLIAKAKAFATGTFAVTAPTGP